MEVPSRSFRGHGGRCDLVPIPAGGKKERGLKAVLSGEWLLAKGRRRGKLGKARRYD
jgi:hypothetical protein